MLIRYYTNRYKLFASSYILFVSMLEEGAKH